MYLVDHPKSLFEMIETKKGPDRHGQDLSL